MSDRLSALLRLISAAALLAGLMVLLLGAYYAVVKAGIPYQDPTVDMQIAYAINQGIGDALLKLGLALAIGGGALRLLLRVTNR